jgi:isoleucyl-tRNA synthetase
MEGAAYIYFSDSDANQILQKFVGDIDLISPSVKTNGVDELRTVLMLSEVHIVEKESDIAKMCDASYISSGATLSGCVIGIRKASGQKCARCWFYDNQVGNHGLPNADACQRCNEAIVSWERLSGTSFVRPVSEAATAIEPVV